MLGGRGRALIQLGLLLLIATPVARVAFSVFAFERQRDWTYVGITFSCWRFWSTASPAGVRMKVE